MTCQDARERLSELLDGLLAEPDRRQLWGHLATCAECARELAGLRQTVALLRRVQPPRAPAGFVERLMERAAPEPWLRRALRGAFVPLGTKLPAQAAAVALLTIGTVYVFQRTPELQKAARTEVPGGWGEVPAPPPAAPRLARRSTEMGRGPSTPPLKATPPSSPGPAIPDRSAGDRPPGAHPADALPVPMTGPADPGAPPRIAPSAPQSEARPLQADESPPGEAVAIAPAPAAPAYTEAAGSRSKEAMSREKRGAREPAPPSVSPPAAGSEPAPSAGAARQETGAATSGVSAVREPARRPAETMESGSTAPPPESPRTEREQVSRAARVLEPADVMGRLVPSDRAALSAALAELIARAGGAEAARQPEGRDLVIEVVVPRAAYADFARGLAGLGQWVVAQDAPDLPPAVRVLIRIAP